MFRPLAFNLCFVSLLVVSASVVQGQSAASASITGRVTDPQGAVVPGAAVNAVNTDTSAVSGAKTTDDGLYHIPNLAPGTYDVSVEAPSFSKAVSRAVHLNVGDTRDVNFSLAAGSVATVVEVITEVPLIQTTKTDVSTVVNESDMQELPVTAATGAGGAAVSGINDFATLAVTAPGVRYDQTTVSNDLIGPGQFNNRNNMINIDGGNITDQVDSGRDAVGGSVDEMKEFQVLTNNYNAEYGQAGGIIINAITKSGTNGIHGDFHFFARGTNMSSSTYFYNLGLLTGGCGGGGCASINDQPKAPFFKHETGFTLGGPLVKNKTFWFVSYEKLLSGTPLTLTPPSGAVTTNQPDDEVLWSAKIDHELTPSNHLAMRFNEQRITQSNELVQISNAATPNSLVNAVVHDHTLNGSLISTINPHLVNEARVFWHRYFSQLPPSTTLPGEQGPNFYTGAAFCCPQGADQNRVEGIENLTWTHGAHTVKGGANFSYFPYVSLFQQYHYGVWQGFTAEGSPPNLNPPTGASGANPATSFTYGAGAGKVRSKDNIYSWYIQDGWKIRPNLTLNYGLRWDYEAGAFRGGSISTANGGCLMSNGIIPACSSDKNNFQPRLGIAWSPNFESGPLHAIFGSNSQSVITASFAEVTELAFLNVVLDSLNFDGVNLATATASNSDPCWPSVVAAFPNFPSSAALGSCAGGGGGFFGRVRPISNHLRNPEVRDANLSIQRQLGANSMLNIEYVGAFGFGQFGEVDANYPPILADPAHPGYFYFGPRPDSRFTAERTNTNGRTSSYNGLIIDVTKRMSHHFQIHGGYTWSHTISSTEDFFGVSEPGDPRTINAERADAEADVRHAVNLGAVIDTKGLISMPGVRHLTNNWQFGIASQLQSGRPWPISTGDVPFADAAFFGIGNESVQRPNVLPDGTISTAGIADAFGNNYLVSSAGVTACLGTAGMTAATCPTANTFLAPSGASPLGALDVITGPNNPNVVDFKQVDGNLKRNSGRSNGYYRTDFSVTRSFGIPWRERTSLELRADFFNVFNHPNFWLFNAAPNTSDMTIPAISPTWGNCTACLNPLTGQYLGSGGQVLTLAALQRGRISPDLGNKIFRGLGDPGGTDIARQMQLSVHVRF
jgi:hypothetical protein